MKGPATTTENPCNYNPVKPDFRQPGRRISEASKNFFKGNFVVFINQKVIFC